MMKRQTAWMGEHAAVVDNHANYIDRLAYYEDTGLTPEQVKDMAENAETRLLAWFEAKYGFPVGKLMDFCEAEQQGRLVVLPCKIGDTVNGKRYNWSGTVAEISINDDGVFLYVNSAGNLLVRPDDVVVVQNRKNGQMLKEGAE